MNEILNQLVTVALGLGILGGSYLVWLLSGVANVVFTKGRTWSWKRMFEDLVKALLMCTAILAWVVVFDALEWFSGKMGADLTSITEGFSVAGVVAGIIGGTVYYLGKGFKNFYEFINQSHTEVKLEETQDYRAVAEKVYEVLRTSAEVVEAHKAFEDELAAENTPVDGGKGSYYSVPIDSYDAFRNTVNGNGYDCDNCYGFQCWDGACLLWMQLGRWLQTGNGAAEGCWRLKRGENAGDDFELITDKNQIKRGDVLVFSCGEFGHIGFADENYNGGSYIKLLGQNQSSDMRFNVINMSLATFMGAFRLKRWNNTPAKPEPTPEQPAGQFSVGDTVVPTRLVDYNGTRLTQWDASYTISEINGNRAVLTAPRNGVAVVWAAMNTANIRKA